MFEEIGRYIVIKLFLKNQLTTDSGISFGIGHGGIEAILLVGINYIYLLITSAYEFAPVMIFLGGLERIFALTFHIGMSVMIMKSIRDKRLIWLILAIILHTLLDVCAVLIGNVYMVELIVLTFAVFSILFIRKEKKNEKSD
ncbi:MAG: YhfC family intramembrane metalloprotease [Peptostreptococcaceae bacterium]|nr:YhfC family intramembrane metalloprotease [Peptostreptococcaceae bacterium]